MTYYVRYALTDDKPIGLAEIEVGLLSVDPRFIIDADLLVLDDQECGQISICDKDGDEFADDIELMKEAAKQSDDGDFLLAALQKATSLVVIQAFFSGKEEKTPQIIKALCKWLMENRAGLLMDENGSFYWNPDDLANLAA